MNCNRIRARAREECVSLEHRFGVQGLRTAGCDELDFVGTARGKRHGNPVSFLFVEIDPHANDRSSTRIGIDPAIKSDTVGVPATSDAGLRAFPRANFVVNSTPPLGRLSGLAPG